MTADNGDRKPWAVLAYTVADDRGGGDALDQPAAAELKSICSAADFGEMNVAAQVDFKHARGVFRGVLTEAPATTRAFEDIPPESHPLWRGIKVRLERSQLRVQREVVDLNAARANVLTSFLRFGQRECAADRYVVFFYGHGYGPLGLFFDAEADDASDTTTLALKGLAGSLHTVSARAAVIVFRACLANTLESAYELRDSAEFMLASQSIVPIAGIWPWATFVTALMPSATSGDVGKAIGRQLALFLETAANREPFADVPYSLIDLGAAEAIVDPLKAIADAIESGRQDPQRASAYAKALERARVGYPDDPSAPGDPALLDVPTLCDNLAELSGDPVAGPARALGAAVASRLVKWHYSRKGHHRGTGLYYQPVTTSDADRSHLYDEGTALKDNVHYEQLALSQATGWHRIALHPLG